MVFQKAILGKWIKQGKEVENIEEFQKTFTTVLTNLKGLDDGLFERYISKNAKFYVDTLLSHETTNVPDFS